MDRKDATNKRRDERAAAFRVVADIRRRVDILHDRRERAAGFSAIHRFAVPARNEERAVAEMDQSVETALRKSRHVRLFSLVELIQLVRSKRDDPQLAVGPLHPVGPLEVLAARDLLGLCACDFPDRIGSGRFEVSASSSFQAAARNGNGGTVADGIVEESASRNRDLPFRLAGLSIEFANYGDV